MAKLFKVSGTGQVQSGPGGGNGGGGGSGSGCDLTDTYPDAAIGGKPELKQYYYQNNSPGPLVVTSVTLVTDHPELWTLDPLNLIGVVLQGGIQPFNLTFTPPAK